MKRVAIYIRVLTEEQVKQGVSLSEQKQACLEKAAAYSADEILVFADEGVSGMSLERPGLTKLREELKMKRLHAVICRSPDRLSRNLAHMQMIIQEIKEADAVLDFVDVDFTRGGISDSKLFCSLRNAIDEYEKEEIRMRRKIHGSQSPR